VLSGVGTSNPQATWKLWQGFTVPLSVYRANVLSIYPSPDPEDQERIASSYDDTNSANP
jgi:hypothetical protein